MAMLFFGGSDYSFFEPVLNIFTNFNINSNIFMSSIFYIPVIASALWLGAKTAILSLLIFILSRGTLPRILFSDLIDFGWTKALPIIMAIFILYIALYCSLDVLPTGMAMFAGITVSLPSENCLRQEYPQK